jgi:hypothetical protein
MPQLQIGESEYRLVGDDGSEGELVEYGDTAILDADGMKLTALVDFDEQTDEIVGMLPEGAKVIDTMTGEVVECQEIETEFVWATDAEAAVGVGAAIVDLDEDEDDESESDPDEEEDDDQDSEGDEDDDLDESGDEEEEEE